MITNYKRATAHYHSRTATKPDRVPIVDPLGVVVGHASVKSDDMIEEDW